MKTQTARQRSMKLRDLPEDERAVLKEEAVGLRTIDKRLRKEDLGILVDDPSEGAAA